MMNKVVKMVLLAMISAPALVGCGTTGEVAPTGPTKPPPGETPATATPPAPGSAEMLTPAQCAAQGGDTIGDRGDGSTRRDGCPNGRKLLGNVKIGIEGGICCTK
jgi:hypothetical protein